MPFAGSARDALNLNIILINNKYVIKIYTIETLFEYELNSIIFIAQTLKLPRERLSPKDSQVEETT